LREVLLPPSPGWTAASARASVGARMASATTLAAREQSFSTRPTIPGFRGLFLQQPNLRRASVSWPDGQPWRRFTRSTSSGRLRTVLAFAAACDAVR
jgi:hypothetical protein